MEGAIGHKTRVIQFYAKGNNNSKDFGSNYQQSLRYIQSSGIQSTPKDLLINDLDKKLQTWQRQGDQLLIMANCNEHIVTGSLGKALTGGKWDLDVSEVSHRAWGNRPPNTHTRGKIPIDGVWASNSLEIAGFKILFFYNSVGDHQRMVFDVTSRSLLGKFEKRVIKPGC